MTKEQKFWAGHPLFECDECLFSTIDGEEALAEHKRLVHTPGVPVTTLLGLGPNRKNRLQSSKEVRSATNNTDQDGVTNT